MTRTLPAPMMELQWNQPQMVIVDDVGDEGANLESTFQTRSSTKTLLLKVRPWATTQTGPGEVQYGEKTVMGLAWAQRSSTPSSGMIWKRKPGS